MHVISAPIADNPVVAVDLLSEQEAAARKRAQEEQDERLARQLSAAEDEQAASRKRAQEEEDERLARQCAAEEAEGSKRGGVQASDDFDAFETPASLEQKRLCGRSGVAGASAPPPSTPRRTRSYTRQQPSVRGRSPQRGRGRRSMMDWFSSADFSGGDM